MSRSPVTSQVNATSDGLGRSQFVGSNGVCLVEALLNIGEELGGNG